MTCGVFSVGTSSWGVSLFLFNGSSTCMVAELAVVLDGPRLPAKIIEDEDAMNRPESRNATQKSLHEGPRDAMRLDAKCAAFVWRMTMCSTVQPFPTHDKLQ